MHSASDRSKSLVARIARVAVWMAVLAALLTAVGSGLLADRLIRSQEDSRLTDAGRDLAREIAKLRDPQEIKNAVGDETLELASIAVGVALMPGGAPEGCFTDGTERKCVVAAGTSHIVTSKSTSQLAAYRRLFFFAALVSVLFAAMIGIFVSRKVAAWASRPLTQLDEALRAFSIDQPTWSLLSESYDCREVDALRIALFELMKRLEDTLARSRRFSADAAHELRTPLTTLRAEIELLLESEASSPSRAALARSHHTLVGMQQLTERLLTLASPAARLVANETVTLAEVVADVTSQLSEAQRARIDIRENADGAVLGDATLLVSMISNAVDNALKFSTGRISITIAEAEGLASVLIEDQGAGISPEERERVFEAFFRSPAARASGVAGHGIGLALIAHIARMHGGSAVFEPATTGAKLRISLPEWHAPREPALLREHGAGADHQRDRAQRF